MSDMNLTTTLTADAGPLNSALRQGAQGFKEFANEARKAQEAANPPSQAPSPKSFSGPGNDEMKRQMESMRQARAEANNLKNAYRQLPAQITDVWTSLLSGQPVWQVAIQQGGQIKDSFGGAAPAARALTAAVTPMMLAVGAAGAAAAVAAIAYAKGAAEAKAYTLAIVNSGNAAGVTRGQLDGMAEAAAKVAGTRGKAADALAQLVGTGQVGGGALEASTIAAIKLQREMGVAVADTVAEFAALGKDPLQASVRLNEQHHYLTRSVYDQIKALQERHRFEEAAEVAQQAYAKAQTARTEELKTELGAIERAWRGVKDAAAEAWDRMLNIGRKKTPQQELSEAQKALDYFNLPTRKSQDPIGDEKRKAALQQRVEELRMQIYMEGEAAAAQQAAADATTRHIKTDQERDAVAKAAADARIQAVKDQLSFTTQAYAAAQQIIDATREQAGITDREYFTARRALIEADRVATVNALAEENRLLAGKKALGAEAVARDSQMAKNRAESARVNAKAATDTVIANAQEEASLMALSRAQAAYWLSLQRSNDAAARANGRSLGEMGMSDRAREVERRAQAIEDRFRAARDALTDDRNGGRITKEQYEQRLQALRSYHNEALADEERYQAARRQLEGDWSVGARAAFENYLDTARNTAEASKQAWTRGFQGMEDAAVSLLTTTKGGFTALANSIIADLIRIYIRQQMVMGMNQGGWMSNLASFFGFGGSASPTAGNAASMDAAANGAGWWHGGGTVGYDRPARTGMVPMSMVANAPRYHRGMLAPDEKVAVLQDGESVLTPGQLRAVARSGAASSPVNITVINQTGQQAEATTRRRADGGIEVLLTAVKESLAGDVAAGSGPLSAALKQRYGLRDATVTY